MLKSPSALQLFEQCSLFIHQKFTVHCIYARHWTLGIRWWKYEVLAFMEMSAAAAAAKSVQSCLTLCDPVDVSPPGSPVPRIPQARTLEWVAISFSNEWKWKVKVLKLQRRHPGRRLGLASWWQPGGLEVWSVVRMSRAGYGSSRGAPLLLIATS